MKFTNVNILNISVLMNKMLLISFLCLIFLLFDVAAQEPAWGTQAKADSLQARDQRATRAFENELDRWAIRDFARDGLKINDLVKTSQFLEHPPMNPDLGEYLAEFERITGTTIILRAYIDIDFVSRWVNIYRASQKKRKEFEVSQAKPAHAIIDIAFAPTMASQFSVENYTISIRDSLRTDAFREIFSDEDFQRMRDTIQATMGNTTNNIDMLDFNIAIVRGLETLKGDILDEVIIQGLSDGYEVLVNTDTTRLTTDRKLRLVYQGESFHLELRKTNRDTIIASNIRWQTQIGFLGRQKEITDSVLFKNIRIGDQNMTIIIFERITDEKNNSKYAKIGEFVFVPRQSPYITFSTPNRYDGEFGFDDGEEHVTDVPKQNGDYHTFQIDVGRDQRRTIYVPWLTLRRGETVNLQTKLSKEIEGDSIYVITSNVDITARYDQMRNILTITNISLENDFSDSTFISFYRDDKYGLQRRMLIGQIAVVGRRDFNPINVQIIYFATNPTRVRNTVDIPRLQQLLNNNSMNQSFARFNVLQDVIIIRDTLDNRTRTNSDDAYAAIRAICMNGRQHTVGHLANTIYIVMTELRFSTDAGEIGGGVRGRTNLAIMYTTNNTTEIKEMLIIHEIGHSLGLWDVHRDIRLGGRPDAPTPRRALTKSNYMDYFVRHRNMYFKTQIETIVNNLIRAQR
jgi:hypothetical protein